MFFAHVLKVGFLPNDMRIIEKLILEMQRFFRRFLELEAMAYFILLNTYNFLKIKHQNLDLIDIFNQLLLVYYSWR